jgi:cysteinyl-tRNA synthetase
MDLSWLSMSAAFSTLQRWREKYQGWSDVGAQSSEQSRQIISEIFQDFCDDLDTPRAMIKLRSIEKDASLSDGEKAEIFNSVDSLFGLNLIKSNPMRQLSEEAAQLLSQRELARSQRDFATSDELRDKLLELGIEVRDSAEGQNWNWKVKL